MLPYIAYMDPMGIGLSRWPLKTHEFTSAAREPFFEDGQMEDAAEVNDDKGPPK